MLALKQALSLVTLNPMGWSPSQESSLVAWYQYRTGVTTSASPDFNVSQWDDQSSNNNHLVQATLSEQPTNGTGVNKGTITFTPANIENLDTTAQITLTGDLTIGIRLNITTAGKTILGDNTSSSEFLKSVDTTNLRFKFDGNTLDFALDDGTLGDGYLVITRTSNEWEIRWDSVLQTDTETQSGTVLIDNVGVRKTDLNAFDGTIKEIQIYSAANATLTADVLARLKNL
jgi:hypothetical protein